MPECYPMSVTRDLMEKGEDMDKKRLGFILLGGSAACWIVTFIGMIANGSQRWTEPFQQAGWIFFVAGFLVLYLMTGRDIVRPNMAKIAYIAGTVSMLLFLVALILNASSDFKSWYEAIETAASIAMLITVMTAIWSVGGWKANNEWGYKTQDK